MKKLFALLGIIVVSSTVFLPQADAAMAEDLTSSVTEVNDPMVSNDKYQVIFTRDDLGVGAELEFTLNAKNYTVKLSDGYYAELMVCAVGDVLNTKSSAIDKGLLKSIERTAYSLVYPMDEKGVDCVKDAEGVYQSVYSVTSHMHDVKLIVGDFEVSTIIIEPKNGGKKQTIPFADVASVDIVSCALMHEQNVTFGELDANVLFAVSDVLSAYGGALYLEDKTYYIRETKKEDCRKNSNGAYVFVSRVEAGEYVTERYEDFAAYPMLLTQYKVTNNKNNTSYEYAVSVDDYYNTHVDLCAAEDVLNMSFKDMDEDLRDTLARISYVNPEQLKRFGTRFFSDCTKNSEGVYVDVPSTKEKVAEGIRILERQIDDTEKVLKQLKEKKYRDAGLYDSGKLSMDQVKTDLADARNLYKEKAYSEALSYLEYGSAGIIDIESLKVTEDAMKLHEEVYMAFDKLYMSDDYYTHGKEIDAIQKKFDEATELYMDGQYEKMIEMETDILKDIEKI